jgi:hypothetical protein
MIHKLSKKTIHIIGIISIFIFIVYLNYTWNSIVTREGLSDIDSVTVNRHKIQLDEMKDTVCLKKKYDEKVEQIKNLNKKLKQMKGMNNATNAQNSANASVTG